MTGSENLTIIFGAQAPTFSDKHLWIEHTSDYAAKFRGDRLTDLGDLEMKKEQK